MLRPTYLAVGAPVICDETEEDFPEYFGMAPVGELTFFFVLSVYLLLSLPSAFYLLHLIIGLEAKREG